MVFMNRNMYIYFNYILFSTSIWNQHLLWIIEIKLQSLWGGYIIERKNCSFGRNNVFYTFPLNTLDTFDNVLKSANPSSNDSFPKTEAKGSVAKTNKENQCNKTDIKFHVLFRLVTFQIGEKYLIPNISSWISDLSPKRQWAHWYSYKINAFLYINQLISNLGWKTGKLTLDKAFRTLEYMSHNIAPMHLKYL